MKRRIIALATVTVLTLALSACGATEESNSSTPTVEQSSQTVTVEDRSTYRGTYTGSYRST